jgi:hypothetical protein
MNYSPFRTTPVFKIAKSQEPKPIMPSNFSQAGKDDFFSQYCVTENWIGDLSSGVLKLGQQTAAFHGLANGDCGLLTLIRCYDAQDNKRILELFEEAATAASNFCFSTSITSVQGVKQPVFCVGESTGLEEQYSGTILGVFMFPRFRIELPTFMA